MYKNLILLIIVQICFWGNIEKTYGFSFSKPFIGLTVDENIQTPKGVFFDKTFRELYVADQSSKKVCIFDENGFLKFSFKTDIAPVNITVTKERQVILTAIYSNNLYIYDYRGRFIKSVDVGLSPSKMAIAPDNNLFLLNSVNKTIVAVNLKEEKTKVFIKNDDLTDKNKKLLLKPNGLFIDDKYNIYVSDYQKKKIYVFDKEGELKLSFGRSGQVDGSFSIIGDLCSDNKGNIYVIDRTKSKIQVFNEKGKFLYAHQVPAITGMAISDKNLFLSSGTYGSLFIYNLN